MSFNKNEEKKMRRLLLLIFVLLLLVDLADDGFPGKARFWYPFSGPSGSTACAPQYNLEQVDSWCELPLIDSLGISNRNQSHPLTFGVLRNFKRLTSCHTSSSGGIPLN